MEIVNRRGLHARASAKFVECAGHFDADIEVSKGGYSVGGTSIMGLMMLNAAQGSHITISATGNSAAEALDALEDLLCCGFNEDR